MTMILPALALLLSVPGADAVLPVEAAAQSESQDSVRVTEEQNGQSVELALGAELVVSLRGNSSTGYGWNVAETPEGLHFAGKSYATDPLPPGVRIMVGRGGTATFIYHGIAEGSWPIRLTYDPPGQGRPAAKTFEITVVVQ